MQEKTLSRYGNSLALVIDKPIRRMLNIGARTKLKLWTDGRRLIVEPLPEVFEPDAPTAPRPGAPRIDTDGERLKIDAFQVGFSLTRRWGMWQEQFDKLYPRKRKLTEYLGWAECFSHQATIEDLETMRRLEACLLARQGGKTWEEATAVALERHPLEGRDPACGF